MNLLSIILAGANLISEKDITTHTDVIKDGNYFATPQRTVYYHVGSLTHNNRTIDDKAVILFVRDGNVSPTSSNNQVTGGFTIQKGQSSTTNGFMRANVNPLNPFGFRTGEVATNGLNGSSTYLMGIDFNGNGSVGKYRLYDNNTFAVAFEQGEGFTSNNFQVEGVPSFPSSTNRVNVTRFNFNSYPDTNGNKVPDYFENQYPQIYGQSPTSDYDFDGINNRDEWIVGTNPLQADNYQIGYQGQDLIFNTKQGREYGIYHRLDFTNAWNKVDSISNNSGNTVYRISNLPFDKGHLKVGVELKEGELD